ncbi:MAG TPA: rhomboid family intramembrane serine protease [Ferruginibacter sp.]|nr:rhomboid family intramembrane serine protease [Ferruginibacter sp.]
MLVFLVQMMFDGPESRVTSALALWPYKTPLFEPYQLVTHMFTHGGVLHILLNMYALWMFGTVLERVWGPKRFLIFYLLCGLAAGVSQMLLSNGPSVGASGAIMGLLAGFGVLFPNTEFYIIPFPFAIKAKYLVMIVAAIDLFGGFHGGKADNIAHFAHLGGLVMGLILVLIWNKTNRKTFY